MAKARDYGLAAGWQLIDTKSKLSVRRAYLAAWARRINSSPERPDHLGDFSVAPSRDDIDHRYGELRALAKSGSRNLEFRCVVPNRKPSKITAAAHIRHALGMAEYFDAARTRGISVKVRRIVQDATASTSKLEVPIRIAAIGLTPYMPPIYDHVVVDLTTVGTNLRTGIQRISSRWISELGERLSDVVADHERFEALRAEAASTGASGWIDGAAERTLAASGLKPSDMLDLFQDQPAIELLWSPVGGEPSTVVLRFRDGVVSAGIGERDGLVGYRQGFLSVRKRGDLPSALQAGLIGRRLDSLLKHPLVPEDPVITKVNAYAGDLMVLADAPSSLLFAGSRPSEVARGRQSSAP